MILKMMNEDGNMFVPIKCGVRVFIKSIPDPEDENKKTSECIIWIWNVHNADLDPDVYVTKKKAYLLNDEGKTIERIH